MNKKLHHRRYIDRLYVSRMERRRGFIRFKMCVKKEENSLECYAKRHFKPLIFAVKISSTVPSENYT